MSSSRLLARSSRALFALPRTSSRAFSSCPSLRNTTDFTEHNKRGNDTAPEYRRYQMEKPLNPHFTNTTSTIANEMPEVGQDAAPPELISAVDSQYTPKDAVPENTERMTGGTQGSKDSDVAAANKAIDGVSAGGAFKASTPKAQKNESMELGVGELEGAKLRVEPLRRTGEDVTTMRARLLYQSRKRGTLESDLLLSTFADANLSTMPAHLLRQYDLFLDENDWDIYYWTTQEPSPTSLETAEGQGADLANPNAQGTSPANTQPKDEWKRQPASGEWAQTVGTFKPAYRPVPQRWKGSEILSLLRRHVKERSAGGVTEGDAKVQGKGLAQGVQGTGGGGLGMMPEIKTFDS